MKNITKIAGAIAMAGVVAAGSSAFTAGGVTSAADMFVGGSITQTVTGATLTSIAYNTDPELEIPSFTIVTLTFAESLAGRGVTLVVDGSDVEDFDCVVGTAPADSTVTCTNLVPTVGVEEIVIAVTA